MDQQLGMLIQLQEVDGAIRAIIEQKSRTPKALEELARRREANKAGVENAKENLQAAQKSKRDRDKDLEAGVQKVEKLKARTSEIKTNKEYQALLKEIETVEQENKTIEDDILALMEKIDAASAGIAAAEQRARQEEEALKAEQQLLEADAVKFEEQLKGQERARADITAGINSSVLSQYQKLLSAKQGIAIAEARGESCSGCYMSIPPQVFVNVKKNESIINCPHCGRILYYKEAIAPKNA